MDVCLFTRSYIGALKADRAIDEGVEGKTIMSYEEERKVSFIQEDDWLRYHSPRRVSGPRRNRILTDYGSNMKMTNRLIDYSGI